MRKLSKALLGVVAFVCLWAVNANALIAPVAVSTPTTSGATNSLIIPKPAGLAATHVEVAYVAWFTATNINIAAPTGFNLIATKKTQDAQGTLNVYCKDVGSNAEPASYTWSFSGTAFNAGVIEAYSGAYTCINFVDVSTTNSAASASPSASSVTTTVNNDWAIGAYILNNSSGTLTFTMPAGLTSRANIAAVSGTNFGLAVGDTGPLSVGATGAFTGSTSGSGPNWGSVTLAVQVVPTTQFIACLDLTNNGNHSGNSAVNNVLPCATNGDILISPISIANNDAITKPASCTLIDPVTSSGVNMEAGYYWCSVGASPPATLTWSWTNSTFFASFMADWRNVNTVTPIDAHNIGASTAATVTWPSVTTNAANEAWLLMSSAEDNPGNIVTVTPPAGFTKTIESNSSSGAGDGGLWLYNAFAALGSNASQSVVFSRSDFYVNEVVTLCPTGGCAAATPSPTATSTATATATSTATATGTATVAPTPGPCRHGSFINREGRRKHIIPGCQ